MGAGVLDTRFDAVTGPYRRTLEAPPIAGALQVTGSAAGSAPSSGLHRAYAATTPASTSLRRHGRNCARARYRNKFPHLSQDYPLIYVLELQSVPQWYQSQVFSSE